MRNKEGQPVCGVTREGPRMGRRVVLWRDYCRRVVKVEGTRCWQHKESA